MIIEIWKDIIGYEGKYQVSSTGAVRSLDRLVKNPRGNGQLQPVKGVVLKQGNNLGYRQVRLCGRTMLVHRLVLAAFVANTREGIQVNHKNGNRADNRIENLEWVTPRENVLYSFRVLKRVPLRGDKVGGAKFTDEKVRHIRRAYAAGGITQEQLAAQFGVMRRTIGKIVNRERWKHVA